MILKRKSLIVTLASSFIIALVLILTLISYLIYIEWRGEEFKRSYEELLAKTSATFYSQYLETQDLAAALEYTGPLRGRAIIKGTIKNIGERTITGILMKAKFLDRDGAVIYEVAFHPGEPSLGIAGLAKVNIRYIAAPRRALLGPGDSLPFKTILTNCPAEIIETLKQKKGFARQKGKWAGDLALEPLEIVF